MNASTTAYRGARIFDGVRMHTGAALLMSGTRIDRIVPVGELPASAERIDLDGGILCPGFVDLQVNGGDGVLFNDAPTPDTLTRMARAHAGLGATSILPTLITDTPAVTAAAIDATEQAIAAGTPGIAGLHLEGPHLSPTRPGAHDPSLICPMDESDLQQLIEAARRLPALKVTLAPESVTEMQIGALAQAGIIVSLGHSDASFEMAQRATRAGATCVTHLFNAMSQLGNREPGLVGAALSLGALSAGLIADLIHVHPEAIRTALAAKTGPGAIFLVSDAMAPAGSEITGFELNGRRIARRDGKLTLPDGTLAGADLDMATAVRNLVGLGVPAEQALAMATSIPARLIGAGAGVGQLVPGEASPLMHLSDEMSLIKVWQTT